MIVISLPLVAFFAIMLIALIVIGSGIGDFNSAESKAYDDPSEDNLEQLGRQIYLLREMQPGNRLECIAMGYAHCFDKTDDIRINHGKLYRRWTFAGKEDHWFEIDRLEDDQVLTNQTNQTTSP